MTKDVELRHKPGPTAGQWALWMVLAYPPLQGYTVWMNWPLLMKVLVPGANASSG